jgi:glutathione S-transferase
LGYTLLLCVAPDQAPLEGEEYANVLAYYERLKKRPAFAKALNPTAAKL